MDLTATREPDNPANRASSGNRRHATAPIRNRPGRGKVDPSDLVAEGGWIVKEVRLAAPSGGSGYSIHLVVEDAGGGRAEQTAAVKVTP
jgi:hypothetical protein